MAATFLFLDSSSLTLEYVSKVVSSVPGTFWKLSHVSSFSYFSWVFLLGHTYTPVGNTLYVELNILLRYTRLYICMHNLAAYDRNQIEVT